MITGDGCPCVRLMDSGRLLDCDLDIRHTGPHHDHSSGCLEWGTGMPDEEIP